MKMVWSLASMFPILVFVWFPITFITTYLISVRRKHVPALFPYISDTGSWAPESCVFGIMLTLGAILLLVILYIRYRHIRVLCDRNNFDAKVRKFNDASIYIATICVFGMLVVANFQETNALIVHVIGANLCFGGAVIWEILQIIISFKIYPVFGNYMINIFRAVCVACCTLCLVLCTIFGLISIIKFHGEDITKWKKEDGGYEYHVVSTITEWLMTFFLEIYFVTFTKEFRFVHFKEPEIIVNEA